MSRLFWMGMAWNVLAAIVLVTSSLVDGEVHQGFWWLMLFSVLNTVGHEIVAKRQGDSK